MIGAFMGTGAAAPTNQGASGSVGVEDNIPSSQQGNNKRQFLANLLGGGAGGNKGTKAVGPPEAGVAAAAGAGAASGLPTCADDGTITMTFRQVSHTLFSTPDLF
jgi:hypothetical protein